MRPSTHLLFAVNYLVLASAASITKPDGSLHAIEKRKCFESGANFGGSGQTAALEAADKACLGALKGKYHKRETRVKCYSIGNNKHVKLTVGLTGDDAGSTRNLGDAECYNGLAKEILQCDKGGDTTYGNWRYRADPNEGGC